jgi:hypothetical protein
MNGLIGPITLLIIILSEVNFQLFILKEIEKHMTIGIFDRINILEHGAYIVLYRKICIREGVSPIHFWIQGVLGVLFLFRVLVWVLSS